MVKRFELGIRGWKREALADLEAGRGLLLLAKGWRKRALRRTFQRLANNDRTGAIDLALALAIPVAHVLCSGANALGKDIKIVSETANAIAVEISSKDGFD